MNTKEKIIKILHATTGGFVSFLEAAGLLSDGTYTNGIQKESIISPFILSTTNNIYYHNRLRLSFSTDGGRYNVECAKLSKEWMRKVIDLATKQTEKTSKEYQEKEEELFTIE